MKKSLLNYALFGMLAIPGAVVVALTTAVPALAQSQQRITVKGTVTDATGDPLIGASIKVKNTVNGVITDFDGNFSLNDVAVGSILEISYVGFNTKEVTVKDGTPITVVLEDDNTALEEVVVVGWSIGKLYLQDTSVLYGFDFNSTTYVGNEAFVYDIVVCKDGTLTLACTCDGRTDAGTFWRFKGF